MFLIDQLLLRNQYYALHKPKKRAIWNNFSDELTPFIEIIYAHGQDNPHFPALVQKLKHINFHPKKKGNGTNDLRAQPPTGTTREGKSTLICSKRGRYLQFKTRKQSITSQVGRNKKKKRRIVDSSTQNSSFQKTLTVSTKCQ